MGLLSQEGGGTRAATGGGSTTNPAGSPGAVGNFRSSSGVQPSSGARAGAVGAKTGGSGVNSPSQPDGGREGGGFRPGFSPRGFGRAGDTRYGSFGRRQSAMRSGSNMSAAAAEGTFNRTTAGRNAQYGQRPAVDNTSVNAAIGRAGDTTTRDAAYQGSAKDQSRLAGGEPVGLSTTVGPGGTIVNQNQRSNPFTRITSKIQDRIPQAPAAPPATGVATGRGPRGLNPAAGPIPNPANPVANVPSPLPEGVINTYLGTGQVGRRVQTPGTSFGPRTRFRGRGGTGRGGDGPQRRGGGPFRRIVMNFESRGRHR